MKTQTLVLLGLLMLAGSACYYDNEEALYGSLQSTCDTTSVTYSLTVAPIIDYNCSSCHSTQDAPSLGDNIVLDQYSLLLNYVNNGRFMGSIRHSAGYSQMPKGSAKLTDCDILKIQTWIDHGKLND